MWCSSISRTVRTRATGAGKARRAAPLLVAFGLAAGCKAPHANIRTEWLDGHYAAAEQSVDAWIVKYHKIPEEELKQAERAPSEDVSDSDLALSYLEKSMLRLAQGDSKAALDYLNHALPAFDDAFVNDWTVWFNPAAMAGGDAQAAFRGADYEHLLLRLMRMICHIVDTRSEIVPYAAQISECQEKICSSSYGEAQKYKPREHYKRVAIGQYLYGVVRERETSAAEARFAYEEGLKIQPDSQILRVALERTSGASPYAPEGHGVVHVFYLGGVGPTLGESKCNADAVALQAILEVVLVTYDRDKWPILFQSPIPVPVVVPGDACVPPLEIRCADADATAQTESLLNVNEVAQQQLEANMNLILARAVLRRAIKELGIESATKKEEDNPLGGFLKSALEFAATDIERADTRSWSTLPAQVQVARLTLPAGDHDLALGLGMTAHVRVRNFDDSFVVVLQPNLAMPGVVLTDPWSRQATTVP